jgi:hypothetical protein
MGKMGNGGIPWVRGEGTVGMEPTGPLIRAIHERVSTRTFAGRDLEERDKAIIRELIRSKSVGPFGSSTRFELIDLSEVDQREIKELGTYGVIKDAKLFIVAAARPSKKAMEDLGYCLEEVILGLTQLGLATCWMGGTFRRSSFARRIHVTGNEIVPAICPVGYAEDEISLADRLIRFIAKSNKRKPWRELFFRGRADAPIGETEAGRYAVPLESVRLAPSASNRQPWRIIQESARSVFHFYLKRTKGYGMIIRGFRIQNIDMGIAMCHFEVAARESGLSGYWEDREPDLDARGAEYVVSWMG